MKAYVYHIIVDGVVRYVGKGTGKRAMSHIAIVRSIIRRRAAGETVRATHFHNRLAKAYRDGADIQIEIVAEGLSDADAFELEIAQIAAHSKLWNLTAGGESPPRATKRSPEFIARVTASNVVAWTDPDLLREHSERMKALWFRPGFREAVSAPRGKKPKMSDAACARWSDPNTRGKMISRMNTPSSKQRRSDSAKVGWIKRRSSQMGGDN